jgi:hypothetical protein
MRALLACFLSVLAVTSLVGCHSGTPAAPEGTRILVDYEYITRDVASGDFEARIFVRALDEVSNAPAVGVGVFFRVEEGPGRFLVQDAVRTTGGGYAENVLIATGATATPPNPVTVSAFSGEAASDTLVLDVLSGSVSQNTPPVASLRVTPSNPRVNMDVTADVGDSTDDDCPDQEPDRWSVDWGDGSPVESFNFSDPEATHQYETAGSYDIEVTVVDCRGATDTATQRVTVTT